MAIRITKAVIEPKLSGRHLHKKIYEDAQQLLAKTRIAASKGDRESLMLSASRYLKKALKYDINEVVIGLSKFLQSYYINDRYDVKKGEYYSKIRMRAVQLYAIENEVDTIYLEWSAKINATKHSKSLIRDLKHVCNEFQQHLHHGNTPINIRIYALMIALAYMENDYPKAISLCNEIIHFLESNQHTFFPVFYNFLIPGLVNEKQYDSARQVIRKAITNTPRTSTNWGIYSYSAFLIEMHSGQYKAAYGIYKKVEHKTTRNNALKERWKIAKGYLSFLIRIGVLEGTSQFKIGKFRNDVPISTADKKGLNVDVLILFILFNLESDKDKLIDKQEAIERYYQRYLTGRSRIFLHMLNSIIHYQFNWNVIAAKNNDRLNRLHHERLLSDEILAFEIIPFEILWNMVEKHHLKPA